MRDPKSKPPRIKNRIDTADIRELLRLAIELLDHRDDPPAAAKMALERLCRLTGASVGLIGIAPAGSPPRLTSVYRYAVPGKPAGRRAAALGERSDAWLAELIDVARAGRARPQRPVTRFHHPADLSPAPASTPRRTATLTDGIYSVLPTPGGSASVIALHQSRPAQLRWGNRELNLVDLLHPELRWLTQPIPTRPSQPREADLSPRQRQTLSLLLRGMSEKQIAGELQLSVHTVHVYVKSIYRNFQVSTRSELLARWVKPTNERQ